jgi:amino acid transporter
MSQHRFPALKTIAWIFRIVAWVIALLTVVFFVIFMFTDSVEFQYEGWVKVAVGLGIILAGALYVLLLYAAAEGILVLLAIEENTRKAAEK